MESFAELGLNPDLVEAFIAEGLERPTALQAEALPVLRRGHSALVRGGPGAGVVALYGAALLDRLEPGAGSPTGIVFTAARDQTAARARALARVALTTGHRVAALSADFALPSHADILVATPADLEAALQAGELRVDGVACWVLDGAGEILDAGAMDTILEVLPDAAQGVVISEPVTPAVRTFVERHLPRAVHIPSDAASDRDAPVQRGSLRVVPDEGRALDTLVHTVASLLSDGEIHHVLLHFRGEDRAADAGDLLGLHGYLAGPPGDAEFPVWLAIDALEARRALDDAEGIGPVAVVSAGSPPDVDELDRRHGGSRGGGTVIAPARHLPHLHRIAGEAGYRIELPSSDPTDDASQQMRERVADAIEHADLATYRSLLEPAIREHGPTRVSAALGWLLQTAESGVSGPASIGTAPEAFMRLFLSVGIRDGVGPGDLVGAITGEAEVSGDLIGRIDIRDTFSRVDVAQRVAARVIEALNGITLKGRSVRADYDRAGDRRRS